MTALLNTFCSAMIRACNSSGVEGALSMPILANASFASADEDGTFRAVVKRLLTPVCIVGNHAGMATKDSERRPGDLFLDRYMARASDAEREHARQNLREFVAVLLRIATRRAREKCERQIHESENDAVELEGGMPPPT